MGEWEKEAWARSFRKNTKIFTVMLKAWCDHRLKECSDLS